MTPSHSTNYQEKANFPNARLFWYGISKTSLYRYSYKYKKETSWVQEIIASLASTKIKKYNLKYLIDNLNYAA